MSPTTNMLKAASSAAFARSRAHAVPAGGARALHASRRRADFHFDTHHFVQRLEREGLNRAQAEGIMTAMAEVIDESIRNMASNMVTKADQEKVRPPHAPMAPRAHRRGSTTTRNKSTLRSSSPSCS